MRSPRAEGASRTSRRPPNDHRPTVVTFDPYDRVAPHCFVNINAKAHSTRAMAARTTAVVSFAICFIFGAGCSWRGAVANGGSWGGCVDNGGSCGVVLKLSKRFFGALSGGRFFFGFRPRLLGICKQ